MVYVISMYFGKFTVLLTIKWLVWKCKHPTRITFISCESTGNNTCRTLGRNKPSQSASDNKNMSNASDLVIYRKIC